MPILDIFSKRMKRERGEYSDVYSYDEFPNKLRVQIHHIISDAVGVDMYRDGVAVKYYEDMHDYLCKEYGKFKLTSTAINKKESFLRFILEEDDVELVLDAVEIACKFIVNVIAIDSGYRGHVRVGLTAEEAISDLNARFNENAIGFQFESNEILRVDSEFVHSEVVKPVLSLLHDVEYRGANEEFLNAHEHYRHKRYKESLVDCLKALESTMKAIFDNRGWEYKSTDNAKNLIAICFDKGLIPTYMSSHFSSLRSTMESGVPTLRNKNGGHGQGAELIIVPGHLARYMLNMTASTILFLVEMNNPVD